MLVIRVGQEIGSNGGAFDATKYGMRNKTELWVSLGKTGGLVFGYKLGYTDGKLIVFIIETEDGIKIIIDKRTMLGSSVGSSERSKDVNFDEWLDVISLGWENGTKMGSSAGSADGIKLGLGEGTKLGSSVGFFDGSNEVRPEG